MKTISLQIPNDIPEKNLKKHIGKDTRKEIILLFTHFNPIWTGVFLGQSWTGGGAKLAPPHLSRPWGIWEIGAKNDFFDDFSEDYFEVHYISVAQKLTILEKIVRFCWKFFTDTRKNLKKYKNYKYLPYTLNVEV